MVLVGVSFLPHGTMILDDSIPGLPMGALEISKHCEDAASIMAANSPEVIIIATPHGLSLAKSCSVLRNDRLSGSAQWNGYWGNYCIDCYSDVKIVDEVVAQLMSASCPVEPITTFSQGYSAPLAWGEVVPLHFHKEKLLQSGTKVVVLCFSQERYSDPIAYMNEAEKIGKVLYNIANTSEVRVGLVFSGDLSHCHGVDAGTPELFCGSSSLGINKAIAERFDELACSWAKTLMEDCNTAGARGILFDQMTELIVDAKVCGWAGMVAIQSCMEIVLAEKTRGGEKAWTGKLHGYAASTYFGMMTASLSLSRL